VNHVDNAGITALVVAAREGCVEARRSGRPPVEWFKGRFHLPCEPTSSTLNIIGSCGLFEGKGVSTSRVSLTRSALNIT
jgi:hypothetical protein